jgi:hypothetical protein
MGHGAWSMRKHSWQEAASSRQKKLKTKNAALKLRVITLRCH